MPTLSYRRLRGDLIEVYKILHEVYDPDTIAFLKLWKDEAPDLPSLRSGTRNSRKLYCSVPRLDIRKFSFSVRVVKVWNSLAENIINAPSVNCFKNRLDDLYKTKDIYYDDYKGTGNDI